MSISNNTVITSAGLDLATSASPSGTLVAIKYFLPSYDYRIDPTRFTDGTPNTIDLSASMSASDTELFGEKIYNIIDIDTYSYSLTSSDNFITSGGTETVIGTAITNPVVTQKSTINLYNGTALSNYFSGTEAVYDTGAWDVTGITNVSGDNSIPTEVINGTDRFFAVTDYYPVSADGEPLKGSWKCRLSKNIGNVKFNKIGLYAIAIDSDGNESGSPVLFAESALSDTITKTDFGTDGFDDIVLDVQIQLASVQANFSDVFFSTSADYWSRTVGGLTYSEKIGVGTFSDGIEEPKAMIHAKSNSYEQFAIGYNDSNYVTYKLDRGSRSTTLNINATVDRTSLHIVYGENIRLMSDGSMEPKTLGVTGNNIALASSLIPVDNDTKALGSSTNALKTVYTNNLEASSSQGAIYLNSTIAPYTSDKVHLGTKTRKFLNIYASNLEVNNGVFQNLYAGLNLDAKAITLNTQPLGLWQDIDASKFKLIQTAISGITGQEEDFVLWNGTEFASSSGEFSVRACVINNTTILSYKIIIKKIVPLETPIYIEFMDTVPQLKNVYNDYSIYGLGNRSYFTGSEQIRINTVSEGRIFLGNGYDSNAWNTILSGNITYENMLEQ